MRRALPIGVLIVALALIVILILIISTPGMPEQPEGRASLEGGNGAEAEPGIDELDTAQALSTSPSPNPTPMSSYLPDPHVLSIEERIGQLDDIPAWTPQPTSTITVVDDAPVVGAVESASVGESSQPPQDQSSESQPVVASGAVSAYIADPIYLADGRWAEVYISVTNNGVSPFLRTGYEYVQPNPDGAHQRVTLLMVIQDDVPQPIIGGEPLWLGHVRFSDGTRWTFPVGCFYIEDVFAEGMEGDFHWQAHYTGGFFDCGNSTHKIVPPIAPGQTATIPLYVYLQHPRLWATEPPPGRSISQIDLEVFDANGASLGIVASRSFGS